MDFSSLTPLDGGYSGETFLARAGDQHTVVRIYARPGSRGAAAAEVDAAVLRLVRGLLPVPEVLEVRRASPVDGLPALLVTELLPGERGDLVLPRLGREGAARLGSTLGRLAGVLGGMPMLRAGPFVDGDLTIGEFPLGDGLPEWVDEHEATLAHWTPEERAGLREVALAAQSLLDAVERRCLVHSDFNLKNILVDPGSLAVTGLVDWEFAHAGHPATDLGNLLRFERCPEFAAAALAAYCDRLGGDAVATLEQARAADLWALVDLAAGRGRHAVADRAHEHLRAIARARDVHAVP